MTRNVGIVIVSHSPLVAEGTADMVRQMVGDEVPLAWCGGDPGGGLGTNVEAIMNARITHTSVRSPTPRAFSRSGSAITSVPELMVASSIPRLVQLSAHHL